MGYPDIDAVPDAWLDTLSEDTLEAARVATTRAASRGGWEDDLERMLLMLGLSGAPA